MRENKTKYYYVGIDEKGDDEHLHGDANKKYRTSKSPFFVTILMEGYNSHFLF